MINSFFEGLINGFSLVPSISNLDKDFGIDLELIFPLTLRFSLAPSVWMFLVRILLWNWNSFNVGTARLYNTLQHSR